MKSCLKLSVLFLLFLFSVLDVNLCAQSSVGPKPTVDSTEQRMVNGLLDLVDTVAVLTTPVEIKYNDTRLIPVNQNNSMMDEDVMTLSDTVYSVYNRFLLPLEYERPYFSDVWRIIRPSFSFEKEKQWLSLSVPPIDDELNTYLAIDSLRKEILHNLMYSNPYLISPPHKPLSSDYLLSDVVNHPIDNSVTLQGFFRPESISGKQKVSNAFSVKNKVGFWNLVNRVALQFSQNYFSTNWQQGGESNLALMSLLNMKANYTHEKGHTFTNELEWRSSFYTAPSDTMRSWRVNDDMFRLSSLLSVKAILKWNYSVSSEFKTRFFNSYKTNTNTRLGSFLSPAEYSLGIGMSYANKFKKLHVKDLQLMLAPYSYSWKYVNDRRVDVTRFGIKKGERKLEQYGSRLDLRFTSDIRKNISWQCRLYYFTTYKNVESEWENTFNFVVNRYFSTRLFFHLRYDDKRTLKSGEDSYFQLKELMSFGLTYYW